MAIIGSAQQLIAYQANGGRSANGAWMFTAGGCPGTFHIDSLAVANATVISTVSRGVTTGDAADTLDGCNPSMSPHMATSDVRVMYILRNASMDHRGYWVCGVEGQPRLKVLWSDAENPYIDETQWSNHQDFAAAKGSLRLTTGPFDIYVYRVWDGTHLKILEGNYSFPYLWVDEATIGVKAPQRRTRPSAGWRVAAGGDGTQPVVDMRGRLVRSRPGAGVYAVTADAGDRRATARTTAVR